MSLITYAGIDVAKDRLDVVLRPTCEYLWLENSEQGTRRLAKRLSKEGLELAVLEATGGLEQPAAAAVALAGSPVAIVNPRQVRYFGKAVGRLGEDRPHRRYGIGALRRDGPAGGASAGRRAGPRAGCDSPQEAADL